MTVVANGEALRWAGLRASGLMNQSKTSVILPRDKAVRAALRVFGMPTSQNPDRVLSQPY